ncbi:MAG: S41 family peptidase [Planctomycetota bacterium]|jgi:hypothetical protein
MGALAALLCGTLALIQEEAVAQSPRARYLADFEFITKTVAQKSAALRRQKKLNWKQVCARLRPDFQTCKDDVSHVKNAMRLLAFLGDSHTGVTRYSVKGDLPGKFDGLFGGGLWFGWEQRRFILRGLMKGHALGNTVPPGSILLAIDGRPAWLVMALEKHRITTYQGSSSDHSLYASLGNRLLPFGKRQQLDLTFMKPDHKTTKVQVRRWGPGGQAFYPWKVQFPDGVEWQKGAVSKMLRFPWCSKVGWLRITGSMDRETATVFHRAFDALKGMQALILDCRGMGGGGDAAAWEMCGRLFPKAVANGSQRKLTPTGSWQFAGPVVMLQDETEISSAETFTWALSETRRVVSVGRPTGGWGIIPKGFSCPSGLLSFRLGVSDRPTPISGIHTEGVGWPPDILIPHGPVFCASPDPAGDVAREVLRLLCAGVARDNVAGLFQTLFAGDVAGFKKKASALAKQVKGFKPDALARQVRTDLVATLEMETAILRNRKAPPPDAAGATRRLDDLLARAKKARLGKRATTLKSTVQKTRREAVAQAALVDLFDAGDSDDRKKRAAFMRKHGKTRVGAWARDALWK